MSAQLSISATTRLGPMPGTIIGDKYRVDGVLGVGGMGVVLSATNLALGAPVAIKLVREELACSAEAVSRLLLEARAVARLRGTHVVRVLDVAQLETGAPYIVMERLDGSDLQATLTARGTLSVPEAVGYVLQACEGLAEAHALGIIHRDLKPENLFLATTPEGVVLKILDFGISKDVGTQASSGARSTLTKAGSAVGSPYYMSPEQMRASPNLDARADIWSLGAILFELLAGRCPFEEETPARLCAKVMTEEAPSLRPINRAVTEQLDRIVLRCLQKDPAARFQGVGELAAALRAVQESRVSLAESARVAFDVDVHAPPPAAARRTAGFALLGLSALLVITELGSWQLRTRPEDAQWLAGQRAAAAELPRRVDVPQTGMPDAARDARAPLSAATPPSVSGGNVPSVSGGNAAVPPASAAHTGKPAQQWRPGPLYYIPPARAAAPAAGSAPSPAHVDSAEERYGL